MLLSIGYLNLLLIVIIIIITLEPYYHSHIISYYLQLWSCSDGSGDNQALCTQFMVSPGQRTALAKSCLASDMRNNMRNVGLLFDTMMQTHTPSQVLAASR